MAIFDIIIPIAPHEYLDNRVLNSIDIPHRLIVQISESIDENPSRMDRIINARNKLRLQTTSEFVLCIDSDVVLVPNLIQYGLHKIQNDPHLGMLGVPTYLGALTDLLGHVKIKCAWVRGDLLRSIPFRWTLMHCECLCFARDLKYRGYQVRYLDTDSYCQVIHNEKNPKTSGSKNY